MRGGRGGRKGEGENKKRDGRGERGGRGEDEKKKNEEKWV